MPFFKKFKSIPYALDGYNKEACNILTSAVIKHMNVDQSFVYQRYVIPDGETPEGLAQDLYGDASKYWTILLVNGIVDPFVDWPMTSDVLEEWVKIKYGNPNRVIYFRHTHTGDFYDDVDSQLYHQMRENGDTLPQEVHPVTALEWETERNLEKTNITVIVPRYINQFSEMFRRSIEGKE